MQVFILQFHSNNRFYKVFNSIEAIKLHFESRNYDIDIYGDNEISIEINDQYGIPQFNGYNTEMIEWFPITPKCERCGLVYCECIPEE